MNTLSMVAFALWALFLRSLPTIVKYLRMLRFSKTVPSATMAELRRNAKKEKILPWLNTLVQRLGPRFCIWFGKDLIVFFSDPEDVRAILSSNELLKKSSNYDLLVPWLGRGLLTSGDAAWHRRRKLLTPAFHFRILSEFKEPMEENCKILMSQLEPLAKSGEPFNFYPYITLFALDVICETAMGIKKNAQLQSESEYVQAVQDICRILHAQSFSTWQRIPFLFKRTAAGRKCDHCLKILHGETVRTIKLRRQLLQDSKITSLDDAEKADDFGTKRRLAFLDMLLLSQIEGGDLTDSEIREEVDTFLFEGHDTTSSTLSFATYLFSQHAAVQQRAYEEAVALEGSEKESMPYLEAVIKETIRLYPPVPFYSRRVQKEVNINGLAIPAGCNISTLSYMVHRNEKFYPRPEEFDPERFLTADQELHPFAFVGFSAGPRNCIGQKFAMLELKATLAYLLRHYEVLPVEGFQPIPLAELVMKSGNGCMIRLKKRS